MTLDDDAPPVAGGAADAESRLAGAVTGGITRGGSGRLTGAESHPDFSGTVIGP